MSEGFHSRIHLITRSFKSRGFLMDSVCSVSPPPSPYVSHVASTPGFEDTSGVSIRFADLLKAHDAPAEIDYLSLDVEGAEDAVMHQFPFEQYRFRVITVEEPSEALTSTLLANGYTFVSTCRQDSNWTSANAFEKLFVHSFSVPGGPAAARSRLLALPIAPPGRRVPTCRPSEDDGRRRSRS